MMHMDNLQSYRSSTAFHQKFIVRVPSRTEQWGGHELSAILPRNTGRAGEEDTPPAEAVEQQMGKGHLHLPTHLP